MSVEVWSILHDGVINQVIGDIPGTVTLTVEIEYLRHMFSGNGNSIIIVLIACDTFNYQPFEPAEILTFLPDINESCPEILYAKVENGVIRVDCAEGTLWLKYKNYLLFLDDGQKIKIDELGEKFNKYWDGWEDGK